jgi:hypothetical protein
MRARTLSEPDWKGRWIDSQSVFKVPKQAMSSGEMSLGCDVTKRSLDIPGIASISHRSSEKERSSLPLL